MIVCRTPAELAAARAATNTPRVLVPTMGALHAGHRALLQRATNAGGSVWATLFVNAIQFNDDADFARYPRDEAGDFAMLSECGVDVVYAPTPEAVWGETEPVSGLGAELGLTTLLEGVCRPGHLEGVEAVVARLFAQTEPDSAVFGEKDYQQLLLIQAMGARAGITILPVPVMREDDGLAHSSRNRLLEPSTRQQASVLPQTLAGLAHDVYGRDAEQCQALAAQAESALKEVGFAVDYVAVCKADDLAGPGAPDAERVVLAAAAIGGVRLLDAWRV